MPILLFALRAYTWTRVTTSVVSRVPAGTPSPALPAPLDYREDARTFGENPEGSLINQHHLDLGQSHQRGDDPERRSSPDELATPLTTMGRGWQDRRDSKTTKDMEGSPISLPASPPSSTAESAVDFLVEPLPKALVDEEVSPPVLQKADSRFPIMRTLLPIGSLSRAHGF